MEVVRSIPQLEALREEWNALADGAGQALLRHEWFASWAATIGRGMALHVAVLRSGGRINAIAPLVAVRVNGVERLEFIGGSSLHEPANLLYEDDAALSDLVDSLIGLRRPLVLQRVPADSPVPDAFQRLAGARAVLRTRVTAPSLSVPVHGTWDAFLGGLPGKLRYDIKRARTRADALGAVSFETVQPEAADVEKLFDQLVVVENAGWKQRNGSALASKPLLREFFFEYAKRTAANGDLRMSFLKIGGEVAAGQLAIQALRCFWVLKIGYDERFSRCSPGFLITCDTLRLAFENGLSAYEFLGSPDTWEERWRPETRAYTLIASYPVSATGAMGACADVAGAAWRRVQKRVHAGFLRRSS